MQTRIRRQRPAKAAEPETVEISQAPSRMTRARRVRPSTTTVAPVVTESPKPVPRARRSRPAPTIAEPIKIVEVPVEEPKVEDVNKWDDSPQTRIIQNYLAKATTPKNAIRAMCVNCMGGYVAEIARCTSKGCPLHPFRMGKNPFHKLAKNHDTED